MRQLVSVCVCVYIYIYAWPYILRGKGIKMNQAFNTAYSDRRVGFENMSAQTSNRLSQWQRSQKGV
jgi:hypothetical protein